MPFSNAEPGQLFAAAALGVANFVGVGYLGSLLAQLPAGAVLPGVIGLAASLYPALSLYAVAYVAVPAVRYALLSKRNAQIAQRNEARPNPNPNPNPSPNPSPSPNEPEP